MAQGKWVRGAVQPACLRDFQGAPHFDDRRRQDAAPDCPRSFLSAFTTLTASGFAQDVLHSAPAITVFYIYSEAGAGKLKRIRNNPNLRIAPCTMRGDVRGVWINGCARICEDDEAARGQQLLTQKYGFLKIVGDFFSRLARHKQTVIAVEFD
jgi:PPOX class probable F420-dependent enzyme